MSSCIAPSHAESLTILNNCVTETVALQSSSTLSSAFSTAQSFVSKTWSNVAALVEQDGIAATKLVYDWSQNTNTTALTAYESACTSAGGATIASQDYMYHCFLYDGLLITGASFVEVKNAPLCVGTSCPMEDDDYYRQAVLEDVIVVNQETGTWTCFGGIYNNGGDDGDDNDIVLGCYTDTTVLEDFTTDVVAALTSIGAPVILGTTDFTGVTAVDSYATTVTYDASAATTLETPCTAAGGTVSTIDSMDVYCVMATTDHEVMIAVDYTISNIPRCLAASCGTTTSSDFDIYEWISTEAMMANGLLTVSNEELWKCALSPPACYADANGLYGDSTTTTTMQVDYTYEVELTSTTSTAAAMAALKRAIVNTVLANVLPATCGNGTTANSFPEVQGMSTFPDDDAVVAGDSCSSTLTSSSNTCQVVMGTLTIYLTSGTATTTALNAQILSTLEASNHLTFAHADIAKLTMQPSASSSSMDMWTDVYNTAKTFVLQWWMYIVGGIGAILLLCVCCKFRSNPKRKEKRAKKKALKKHNKKKAKKVKKGKAAADANQPVIQKAGFVGRMFGAKDQIHLPRQKRGWGQRRQPQVVVVPA